MKIQAHYILWPRLWSFQLEPGCSQPVPLRVFPQRDIFNPFWEQRKSTRKHCILQNRLGANTDWKTIWKQTRMHTHAHLFHLHIAKLLSRPRLWLCYVSGYLSVFLVLSAEERSNAFSPLQYLKGVASLPPWLPATHQFFISGSTAVVLILPVFSLACHRLDPWGFPLTCCCSGRHLSLELYPSPSLTHLPEELSILHCHCPQALPLSSRQISFAPHI